MGTGLEKWENLTNPVRRCNQIVTHRLSSALPFFKYGSKRPLPTHSNSKLDLVFVTDSRDEKSEKKRYYHCHITV